MSQKLVSLNPDLKRLRDEGYEIEIRKGHLLVHGVPYVTAQKEVAFGVLVTPLGDLAGDKTARPESHVMFFIGEHPCDNEGHVIKGIQHASGRTKLADGVEVDHAFSNKPSDGYPDYYEKVVNYCRIISGYAQVIDSSVTSRTYKVIEETDDSDEVFNYLDTNSSRAEIEAISSRVRGVKVAIVGLGGTGSYVLDFVSKNPVAEIHLFDEDRLLSHNAFRAPGAASLEELREEPRKVDYLQKIYSKMHKHIVPHEYHLSSVNLEELSAMNFVFICIDDGEAKKVIIDKLIEGAIPFADVGMGVTAIDGRLTGSVRVTTATVEKHDHIEGRVSFSGDDDDDYEKNIQIAELNALNAALAVIKWKKLFGIYHDLEREYHTAYEISENKLHNDEAVS